MSIDWSLSLEPLSKHYDNSYMISFSTPLYSLSHCLTRGPRYQVQGTLTRSESGPSLSSVVPMLFLRPTRSTASTSSPTPESLRQVYQTKIHYIILSRRVPRADSFASEASQHISIAAVIEARCAAVQQTPCLVITKVSRQVNK